MRPRRAHWIISAYQPTPVFAMAGFFCDGSPFAKQMRIVQVKFCRGAEPAFTTALPLLRPRQWPPRGSIYEQSVFQALRRCSRADAWCMSARACTVRNSRTSPRIASKVPDRGAVQRYVRGMHIRVGGCVCRGLMSYGMCRTMQLLGGGIR